MTISRDYQQYQLPPWYKRRKLWRTIGIITAAITIVFMTFIVRITQTVKTITAQPSPEHRVNTPSPTVLQQVKETLNNTDTPLLGEQEQRVNILLLGIGGDGHDGGQLTDTILLASIYPDTHEIGLLSIPRDLAVTYNNQTMKINAVMTTASTKDSNGIPELMQVIQEITGQTIPYYIRTDFQGFEEIVDALGGITITLDEAINDPTYPGPNHSYEGFSIDAGVQKVDGATALKIARSRHTTSGGDFGRAKRQHDILEAIYQQAQHKFGTLNIIKIHQLLEIIEEHVRTNMTLQELNHLYGIVQEKSPTIHSFVVSDQQPWPTVKSQYIPVRGGRSYVLTPDYEQAHHYEEIQFIASHLQDIETIRELKNKAKNEHATVQIIAQTSENIQQQIRVLSKLGIQVALTEPSTPQQKIEVSTPTTATLLQYFFPKDFVIVLPSP